MPDPDTENDKKRQPGDIKDIMPDENWIQRMLRKITPLGPAYPAWIAVILISLILLFTLIIRIILDYNLLEMK